MAAPVYRHSKFAGVVERVADGVQFCADVAGNKESDELQRWLEAAPENAIAPYEPPAPSSAEINAERDRRIDAGFVFAGVLYQSAAADRENISGAGILAAVAMMGGAQPGDLRWHGGDADFAWIAADNSLVPMDAPTVIAFGQVAASWKMQHIFAARALKDSPPIPADYVEGHYWPASG
jgi:Domain of unknown function (DUF4376)